LPHAQDIRIGLLRSQKSVLCTANDGIPADAAPPAPDRNAVLNYVGSAPQPGIRLTALRSVCSGRKTTELRPHSSTNSPCSVSEIRGTGRGGTLNLYRAWRRSPSLINALFSVRSAKSRVVVAGDAPVIELYLPAVSPPLKASGPSLNIRRRAFRCLSFSSAPKAGRRVWSCRSGIR
jgi:hypothetical protein